MKETTTPPRLREGAGGRLAVLGAINWDISIFEERFPRPGEEVPVRLVEEFSGGKGANVAVAAARILGRGRVAFVGALGDDEVSGMQLGGLREEGVLTDGVLILRGRRSGRAYIVVDRGGRKTIHTHFGANEGLLPRHLRRGGPLKMISSSGMVIVMDVPLQVAATATEEAKAKGASLLYSPGVRTQEGLAKLEGVIGRSDYLVIDSHELRNLSGKTDVEDSLETIRGSFSSLTVVATLGQRGCAVSRDGRVDRVEGVELASLGKRAVNSTGSGDAFLGVFASYLLQGSNVLDAVVRGNIAGALKATRYETRGSPRVKELEVALRRLERVRRSGLGFSDEARR